MAMIKCLECSSEVSDSALTCPSCGVQLRKPKRSFFGTLIKWSFIGFNILMAISLVVGMNGATESMNAAMSEAEKAGAAIGTGLGAAMILSIWVFGDIILGLFVLFTRPKS